MMVAGSLSLPSHVDNAICNAFCKPGEGVFQKAFQWFVNCNGQFIHQQIAYVSHMTYNMWDTYMR